MTAFDARAPVLVGVGQRAQRDVSDATQPGELMAEAVRAAVRDAKAPRLLRHVDLVALVESLSWRRCANPAGTLGRLIGARPRRTVTTRSGGNSPLMLVNRLAEDISNGACDAAVIAGAETVYSRRRARRAGLPVVELPGRPDLPPDDFVGDPREPRHPAEIAAGLEVPLDYYPLLEEAIRAHARRPLDEHLGRIAELWSAFSDVAARNPYAWDRARHSPAALLSDADGNRMVSTPYRKRMTSNIDVDLGAALILCSAETAAAAGVPRDRWVFVHAGAEASDHWFVSERPDLHRSPAIHAAATAALDHASASIDDIAYLDLYSCFPSAVQIAATELGIGIDRGLTVTGGLSFAGGPANNYASHAVATMVDILRGDPSALGLCSGLGWFVTKHAYAVFGGSPPALAYRRAEPQAALDRLPKVVVAADHAGPITIETATVQFDRSKAMSRALAVGRTPDGGRCWATSADQAVLEVIARGESLGIAASRRADGELVLG